MISISLTKVVSFLRPRGALAVLEGAPYIVLDRDGASRLCGVWLPDLDHFEENTALYLGSGEVCPAAEGWAVRLLALSVGCSATHLHMGPRERVALFDGSRLQCQWIWRPEMVVGRLFRETTILGVMPSTPAERLAAVLNYELDR